MAVEAEPTDPQRVLPIGEPEVEHQAWVLGISWPPRKGLKASQGKPTCRGGRRTGQGGGAGGVGCSVARAGLPAFLRHRREPSSLPSG